ncbi:hypothetical protein C1H76_0876 [Elsinoe australis]|uniref:Alkyl hydroperoxide reductase subunit C/ Thiol specific antioxidant domain-containing protein n=1 Tax=Elsinoe australis TaxID=40998 RepID=A0A4V6DV36_9PEZI|nr:hypothetical protein C1H76_0876 [Elsinoe australis]
MTTVPEQYITNRPNGWVDWAQTFTSVLPKLTGPTVGPLPDLASPAPTALGPINFTTSPAPTLVAFVRHCGCPFAEKEVRLLADEADRNASLRIVIVQHSSEADTRDWFERIGGTTLFPDQSRVTLVSDVNRELYAAWGIGQLGWGQMVNADIMRRLHENKVKEGLDLTKSDWTSYRWQNSGGFAVDREGRVRWRHLASDSSDVCDFRKAADALFEGAA